MNLEMYREVLLAHNEQPHHFYPLSQPTHTAYGHNPLCGDEITVYVRTEENRVKGLPFTEQTCAVCKASASLMTVRLEGQNIADAEKDAQAVLEWLNNATAEAPKDLGELEALLGVRKFPMRIKCATLAWHAFLKALNQPTGSDEAKGSACGCCGGRNTSDNCGHPDGCCGCGA